MNKGVKRGFLIGGLAVVGLTAFFIYRLYFHTSEEHLKVIPKDATAVLQVNIKGLAGKADIAKLMELPAFKKNISGKGTLDQLVSDPFAAGIDPTQNVYGFLAKEGENTVTALSFSVKDADDFEKFEKELKIGTAEPELADGIHFQEIDKTHCLAWNDDAGLFLATSGGDTRTIARKYLSQQKPQSILANENYKTFSAKTADIALFIDNKMLAQMSGSGTALAPMGMTDGHGEVLINFENDKIAAVYNNYPATVSSADVLRKSGLAAKHFEAVAPANPLVYLGLATDINAVFTSIENDSQMKDNITAMEAYLQMPDADLRKLFNGDASIAFTDFKDISAYDPRVAEMVNKALAESGGGAEDRAEYALNAPMAYITLGETDDAKVSKMLGAFGMQETDGFYFLPGMNFIVYAVAKNGHLLITNDYYAAETISRSGKFPLPVSDDISRKDPFFLHVDLNQKHFPPSFLAAMQQEYDEQTVSFALTALKPFTEIRMQNIEKGSELDILLEPGEGNSLHRLLAHFASLAN